MVMKMELNGLYRLTDVEVSPFGKCLRLEYVGGVPDEKPKKTVVKEAEPIAPIRIGSMSWMHDFIIPINAKNVKCTYEVLE